MFPFISSKILLLYASLCCLICPIFIIIGPCNFCRFCKWNLLFWITWSLKWQPQQLNVFWGNSYLLYYYQNAKRNFISVALGFDFCDSWQLFRRFVCVAQATSEVFFSWAKLLLVLQFYVISSGLAWFKKFFYLSSQWIFGCWLQFYSKKFSINICD